MKEPLAQVSSTSSQQKWKYGSYKVSIASERLVENEWVNTRYVLVYIRASHNSSHTRILTIANFVARFSQKLLGRPTYLRIGGPVVFTMEVCISI